MAGPARASRWSPGLVSGSQRGPGREPAGVPCQRIQAHPGPALSEFQVLRSCGCVLLVEAVSPAERGELEVSSPRQEWAVSQQVPVSSSKHESAPAAPGGCSSAPVTSPDQGCRLPPALLLPF
ncbi:hypothetical protein DV515_00010501 [Chloebia gouldiae]|uniref:Uncharacterized protein n=1 Tax=Chloebia gouldiae TaxID=44316 RepID=A0A3L8S9M7_CHLGU|nr:hypothetical protein DV515_00010501 [Chloebia gouldiae]